MYADILNRDSHMAMHGFAHNLTAALLISISCLLSLYGQAASNDNVDPVALVRSSLLGKDSSPDALRNAGMDAITAIESVLDERDAIDAKQVQHLVERLGLEKFKERQSATQAMSMLPGHILPLLEEHLSTTDEPEVRIRLGTVIGNIRTTSKQVPALVKLLHELYNKHAVDILKSRWPAVKKDPFNLHTLYALNHLPFDRTWHHFRDKGKEEQLTFLLLKVYSGDSEQAIALLREFSGGDVLRVAAATWWPVEIESPKRDGAYSWTTRAGHTKGNVAYGVIRMSIRGDSANPGGWIHLNRLGNVTYIFKYPSYVSKDVAVCGELARSLSYPAAWRNTEPRYSRNEAYIATMRDAPDTASLPFVSLSVKERMDWTGRHAFEWAKPLFPTSIVNKVKFLPNKYPLPEVRMPDDQARGNKVTPGSTDRNRTPHR